MSGPSSPGPSRARRRLTGLAVSAGVLLVLLIATEVALRMGEWPFRATFTPSENAMARFDPDLGWSYIPNRSYSRAFGRDRRPVSIHFDGIGARVAAPGTSGDGRPALIFVGGSYTMGHGVTYDESFPGLLGADPDLPFQVVNLGVQGYGTDQALLRLEAHIDEFDVAAVIYTFIESHILRNSNDDRRLIIPYATFLGTKPLFGLQGDGSLYLKKKPQRYEEMFQSNLVNWIRLWWSQNGPLPGPELTEALLLRMKEVTESRGARFVVVLWRQEIAYPRSVGKIRRWEGELPVRSLGLSMVDTGVDAPPDWGDWVIPGDYHPDTRAHARVAGLLKKKLRQPGMLPQVEAAGGD